MLLWVVLMQNRGFFGRVSENIEKLLKAQNYEGLVKLCGAIRDDRDHYHADDVVRALTELAKLHYFGVPARDNLPPIIGQDTATAGNLCNEAVVYAASREVSATSAKNLLRLIAVTRDKRATSTNNPKPAQMGKHKLQIKFPKRPVLHSHPIGWALVVILTLAVFFLSPQTSPISMLRDGFDTNLGLALGLGLFCMIGGFAAPLFRHVNQALIGRRPKNVSSRTGRQAVLLGMSVLLLAAIFTLISVGTEII